MFKKYRIYKIKISLILNDISLNIHILICVKCFYSC